MRRTMLVTAALAAWLSAGGHAEAQSIMVGPGGVRVYDDRGPPPPPPPPRYDDRYDYGPRRGYGPPLPPPPRGGGDVCAYENGYCSFRGYAVVRYGARGSYVSRQARDGIPCNNRIFGDPAPGIPKRCIIED